MEDGWLFIAYALHIFDCTKYSMDAFTGKEQNRANVVPIKNRKEF